MAETTIDLRGLPLTEAYEELWGQTKAVLEGVDDQVAAMATISALIHHGFGHLWTGFYRVVENDKLLRVGPYQGTLGCMEIQFGKGVFDSPGQFGSRQWQGLRADPEQCCREGRQSSHQADG